MNLKASCGYTGLGRPGVCCEHSAEATQGELGDLEGQLKDALSGRQAFPHTTEQTATEAARCVLLWRCPRGQASGLSQTHSEVTEKRRTPTSLSLATLGHPGSFTTEIPGC